MTDGLTSAMQLYSWGVAGALLALAIVAGVAEHLRRRRRDMDKVGWVPWTLVQFMALVGVASAVIVATHS